MCILSAQQVQNHMMCAHKLARLRSLPDTVVIRSVRKYTTTVIVCTSWPNRITSPSKRKEKYKLLWKRKKVSKRINANNGGSWARDIPHLYVYTFRDCLYSLATWCTFYIFTGTFYTCLYRRGTPSDPFYYVLARRINMCVDRPESGKDVHTPHASL